jgi:hypothetical protein
LYGREIFAWYGGHIINLELRLFFCLELNSSSEVIALSVMTSTSILSLRAFPEKHIFQRVFPIISSSKEVK